MKQPAGQVWRRAGQLTALAGLAVLGFLDLLLGLFDPSLSRPARWNRRRRWRPRPPSCSSRFRPAPVAVAPPAGPAGVAVARGHLRPQRETACSCPDRRIGERGPPGRRSTGSAVVVHCGRSRPSTS